MGIIAPGTISPDQQQPPPISDNPDETYAGKLRDFIDRKACYDHIHHIRKFRRYRKADLFYQSKQWLAASYNVDPTQTPHWSERVHEPDDPDQIPMPVYNEVAAHIQNEAARLGRPEYKAYVRPSGSNPDAKTKEACRYAVEILNARKEEMGWDEIAEEGFHHMPVYGGWWIKSWWDTSMDKTVRVPVSTAMKCTEPGCNFKVASTDLTPEQAGQVDAEKADQPTRIIGQDHIDPKLGHSVKYSFDSCLQCDTHTTQGPQTDELGQPLIDPQTNSYVMGPVNAPGPAKLEPFTPVDDELQEQDQFGRSFGKDVPLGEWCVRNLSGYDVFAENLGMDISFNTLREIAEVHVESLDWIRSRYPDKADQVKAESPAALLKWHPILGERALFSGTSTGNNIFRNHCRVKEFHKKPYYERDATTGKWAMNLGRSIIMAGNVVLLDGPFMIESQAKPGTYVERVHYDYVPWELRSGGRELDGVSLMEMMFDAQENINEAKSQTQDCRKRMASPKWLVPRAMGLDYEQSGGAAAHWLYDPDPNAPTLTPKEVGSTTISEGVASEITRDMEYLERVSGKSAVEDGSVPGGVSAAAAIQMLAEHTAERRRPRIRRIRKMFERVWRHGLELMHEFVREDRTYSTKNDTDEWTDRSWSGKTISGQMDVRIDAEPDHDTEVQKQERVRDAIINLRLLNPADPVQGPAIANELDLDPSLFEQANLQDEAAEREFIDFLDQGREPVIDTDLDSDPQHYDRHGRDCHSEKWRALEKDANWDQALAFLWGWDEQKPLPMPPPPPGMMPMAPPMMSKFDMFEQTVAPQMKLPPLPELHIAACWAWILGTAGVQMTEPLQKVIRFRSHMAQHRRNEQQQQNAAQAGAPQVAAPQAPATASGTVPPEMPPLEGMAA